METLRQPTLAIALSIGIAVAVLAVTLITGVEARLIPRTSPGSESNPTHTGTASGPSFTLEFATISKGGGILADGSILVIGQSAVGTMSNAEYTMEVGIVPLLTASACPTSSAAVEEALADDGSVASVGPPNRKNRYISVRTADPGQIQAIRVRFVDLPAPFDIWEHDHPERVGPGDFFVGAPFKLCENGGQGSDVLAPDDCAGAGGLARRWFWAAPLVCGKGNAHSMDWHGVCTGGVCDGGLLDGEACATSADCADFVHIYHEGLVPDGTYDIQVVDIAGCNLNDDNSFSTPLTLTQNRWGDVCGAGAGGACTGVADGSPDVAQDVLGLIDKFQNINALQKSRADLVPGDNGINNGPDFKVTIAGDTLFALDAFQGDPYPFTPGDPCAPG